RSRSCDRLREPAELAAQLLQAQPHPALDGADRRLEHLGDLRMREAAEVGQLDDLALLGWERSERLAHVARLVAARGLDVRALAGLQALLDALVAGAAAVVDHRAPQRVDRAVVHDAEDPRAHRAARAVVARARAPE